LKHILDSSFRYKPSFDTDVRKTFQRIRKAAAPKAKPQSDVRVKVLELDQRKRAAGR
jgi:hypothetical protein